MVDDARATGPIVVGYDGSAPAVHALEEVAALFPGREVIVACIAETSGTWDVLYRAVLQDVQGELEQMATELAAKGVARAEAMGIDARPAAAVHHGPSWQGLLQVARDAGAAAVVVGARGMSTISSAVLGSVSSGVMHHADGMPVLVVTKGKPGEAAAAE